MSENQDPGSLPQPPEKKKGCFFYGMVGCLGIVIFIGGVIGFTVWKIMDSVKPHDIEKVVLTQQEQQTFDTKVETLKRGKGHSLPSNTAAPSVPAPGAAISFSDREISSLLSNLDFGNHLFQVGFTRDRIQVLANIPVPKELPGLEGEDAQKFSQALSALPIGHQIPFRAEAKISLRDGRPFLQLISADMMGLPLEALFGPKWSAWKEIDILSKFGDKAPVLESIFGHLQHLQFDEKGLHLTPR